MSSAAQTSNNSNNNNIDETKVTIRRRRVPSSRRKDGLIKYAKNNTSQGGEDGIIERIFQLLPPPESSCRYCVDVGAWDGVHLSNTHSLLVPVSSEKDEQPKKEQAERTDSKMSASSLWKGILIEAVQDRFEMLQNLHQPLGNICINTSVSCIKDSIHSLPSILQQHTKFIPSNFDFLCIDVDGPDYWLWHDILQNSPYRPKVVCIEFNPTMPHDLIYIQPRNDSIRHGSSLPALVELGETNNYVLVETTMYNAFFVEKELYDAYLKDEVPDTTIEALHEVTMGTTLYQLYNGTIQLSGCKKLLWHRIPIEEEDIQVLPAEKRDFPFAPNSSTNGGATASSTYSVPSIVTDPKREEEARKVREVAVDMSPYCSLNQNEKEENADKATCAAKLYKQLQKNGFAYVKGTNISPSLCKDALKATNLFLNEADEEVRRSCLTKDRARRGYSPMCTENFASLVGEEGPNDLVRKFRVGPIIEEIEDEKEMKGEGDGGTEKRTSAASASSPLLRPNIWPDEDVWDKESIAYFRKSIESYFKESCRVSHAIVCAICDGLLQSVDDSAEISIDLLRASVDALLQSSALNTNTNQKEDIASPHGDDSDTSILTLLGYQKGSRHKQNGKQIRPLVAPHTDVGVVTMLLFDEGDSATLQRVDKMEDEIEEEKKKWVDVILPRIDDQSDPVFVINIGDCLSELSHGMLPSTLHRVIPKIVPGGGKKGKKKKKNAGAIAPPVIPRNCLALFVGLEPSRMLTLPPSSPTTTTTDEGGEEMTYEEWRKRRIARAAKVLREKSNANAYTKK